MHKVRFTLLRRRLLLVVLAALAVHSAWIAVYVARGHEARDFIHIGLQWVVKSDVSDDIVVDPTYRYPRSRDKDINSLRGYDGQFYYFIALDPRNARFYMRRPAYRYSRILYPAVASAVVGGANDAIPYSLVVVNWLAIAFGTLAVALLLVRRGASPWWALAFGAAPGMLLALQRDLTEPLAYGLAAVGVLVLARGGRQAHLLAGVVFALAVLARQTTAVIPLVYALWMARGWSPNTRPEPKRAAIMFALAVLPFLAWTLFLRAWLGELGGGEPFVKWPFGWLFARRFSWAAQPPVFVFVVLPAMVWAVVAVRALRAGQRHPEWACLALNVLAFVVFGPPYNAYTSVGRAILGVVLMAVLAAPYAATLGRGSRQALVAASAVWAAMLPVIFVYGLSTFRV